MNVKEALKSKYSILVFIDIFMMVLLIINLSLIIFDWIFSISLIGQILQEHLPDFYSIYYDNIHINFSTIDLAFVAVFLSEFIFSWILAVIQKIYHKWFFYPFLHWYDLVGCIPVGSLRFVRILRVFSILVRLQNLKIIDLSNTYIYTSLKKYYGIVVEEVSDRVVVNILEGVQEEISSGGPVVDSIINEVIRPKQDLLVEWISRRLENALERDVLIRKHEIEAYVENLISEGLGKNSELKIIEQLPIMGKLITETIENTISDVINNIIEKALTDLASYKNRALVNDATNVILNSIEHKDEESDLNEIFSDISIEVIEIIKKQVQIQKWKLKEETERGADANEIKGIEFLMADKK
ncbi:MAG: hypothetical protein KAR17_03395 [Cyclobacteriaceae bacterium]|nr:hypothetical protein [Cyclobacteriaceae bacterium]MCK5280778.1 hypothetical protein [Cyclobacteriaceae bacterium]